ncbi:unnamed protein product [Cuscuta campestris]|uniref:Uncharacterized protein n=1 Tax=Cuscuta campestris TaxID=132261 RepID=A0A484LUE3_9ASTE|nr:unnamed protein product [Cuscuta campestris]
MNPSGFDFFPDDLEPHEHAMWIFQQFGSNPSMFETPLSRYVYERESVPETQPEPSGTKKNARRKNYKAKGTQAMTEASRFHIVADHVTNECKVLKREIENLIQAGHLSQFVKKRNTWRKDNEKKPADNRRKKAAEASQKRKEIGLLSDKEEEVSLKQNRVEENLMIYGGNTRGDSAKQRKKWVHSTYVGDVISSALGQSKMVRLEPILFCPMDAPQIPSPHRDALALKCEINDVVIHHSYVDNGSSVNINMKTFEELGLKKELLRKVRTSLSGFTYH